MMIYPIKEISDSLKRHEGYAQHAYVCPAGATSVGYGRNLDEKHGGLGISQEDAEYLLANDIKRSIEECERFGWWEDCPMDKRQVIIELCFQMGWPSLTNFNRMLSHMAKQSYDLAAVELLDSRFARQVPHRAAELAERLRA